VASVNSSEFLTDDQNRRYLVFSVKDIDFKTSGKLDRAQIWAQVKYLLNNNFRYWFDLDENEQISTINDAFRVKPEEEEMLMQFFEPDEKGKPMMQTEILQYLQARSTSRLNSRILSTSLKKRDFPRKGVRMKVGNKESTRYVYLVKELSDFDRVVQEHKIVAELAADDALNK
jgi:predicted P-loop ATPase